jgi:hypothetical protein
VTPALVTMARMFADSTQFRVRPDRRRRTWAAAVLLLAAALAGCTTTKVVQQPDGSQRVVKTSSSSNKPGAGGGNPAVFTDPLASADPCAARLHDLCEPLLLYYATHGKRLPQRLEEVKAFSDFDKPIELTCPTSGQPYTYNPTGLVTTVPAPAGAIAAEPTRLIVYDPSPAHNGSRKGIVIRVPSAGQAPTLYEVTLTEPQFQTYVPATEPLFAPAPAVSRPTVEQIPIRRPNVPE